MSSTGRPWGNTLTRTTEALPDGLACHLSRGVHDASGHAPEATPSVITHAGTGQSRGRTTDNDDAGLLVCAHDRAARGGGERGRGRVLGCGYDMTGELRLGHAKPGGRLVDLDTAGAGPDASPRELAGVPAGVVADKGERTRFRTSLRCAPLRRDGGAGELVAVTAVAATTPLPHAASPSTLASSSSTASSGTRVNQAEPRALRTHARS